MDAWPQAGQRKRKERDKTWTNDFLFTSLLELLVAQRVNCILARRAQGRVESSNAAADKSHQQ